MKQPGIESARLVLYRKPCSSNNSQVAYHGAPAFHKWVNGHPCPLRPGGPVAQPYNHVIRRVCFVFCLPLPRSLNGPIHQPCPLHDIKIPLQRSTLISFQSAHSITHSWKVEGSTATQHGSERSRVLRAPWTTCLTEPRTHSQTGILLNPHVTCTTLKPVLI